MNNFYTVIPSLDFNQRKMLTVLKPNAKFNMFYRAHPHLAKEQFFIETPQGICIATGLLEILGYTKKPPIPNDLKLRISEVLKNIQPFELRDFQVDAICDALFLKNLFIRAATGSGKSAIIAMIAKILCSGGLQGVILVPNISLVNQFDADLKDYKIDIPVKLIGGKYNDKSLDSTLTISTWQSLYKNKKPLENLDFIIIDEAHQAKAKEIFEIAKACKNAKYKIGLTGTIPQDHYSFLKICSVFGIPKSYVSPRQLIDAGLGTGIKINLCNFNHTEWQFSDYQKALSHIVKSNERNAAIANLAKRLKGNTIVLVSRNEHAHRLFKLLMPCETDEKSYKDLVLQNHHNIYFINGNIEGSQRESVRNLLESKQNAILVSNYSVLSTGVNIRNLHNLILASPMKSYILITQSLGRLIRTHESKTEVNVFDICDNIGFFIKQRKDRIRDCYKPQGYETTEYFQNDWVI